MKVAEEEEKEKPTGCIKCGDCCRRFIIRPNVGPKVQEFLGEVYGRPIESLTIRLTKRCVNLGDDNLCTIYERRPVICREYLCEAAQGTGPRTIILEADEVAG